MIKHLGIVGAGTMGTGIAHLAAISKISISIYDVNETILRRSIEQIRANIRKAVNLGSLPPEELPVIMERIRTRTSISDLAHCDFIIESVIEDIRVKKDLFKHLDGNTRSSAVLASTTASLSITSISSLTRNPERIIGTHFFNAVDKTNLVEVVKGHKTNDETIESAKSLIALLGKIPIIVKDTPGFIASRVSHPFYGEALRLLGENVADAGQIDKIVRTLGGFQNGPFESMDIMGIDAAQQINQSLYEQSNGESRFRPHPILKQMIESGLLGKKAKNGFFSYEESNGK
jgi:3-hydroxybutyryl-CoA dehydrogenase